MKLTIGFSPCPNDTFIFDAIVNKRIDTLGLEFEPYIADVEELNKMAFNAELDCTKLSFHSIFKVLDRYAVLNSGSALGLNNGPLLISKNKIDLSKINDYRVAIPGENTTANLLFKIAFPEFVNKEEYLFSDVVKAILDGHVDAGLIIHETRFTYESKGLRKLMDFGEFWNDLTSMPLPLGGIVVNRKLPISIQRNVQQVISNSIRYAFNNREISNEYIKCHSQELDDEVIQQHINLYVNDYSLDFGVVGRKAISKLHELGGFDVPDSSFYAS